MAGTLYTCSIKNINKTPEDSVRLFITLYAKADLVETLHTKYNVLHISELAPNPATFSKYKQTKDIDKESAWEEYVRNYTTDIILNKTKQRYLNRILELLKTGKDVTLICYCSDEYCHRHILRRYFENYHMIVKEV
jgi:uncharacterized protein YeaO (DUF488 family)